MVPHCLKVKVHVTWPLQFSLRPLKWGGVYIIWLSLYKILKSADDSIVRKQVSGLLGMRVEEMDGLQWDMRKVLGVMEMFILIMVVFSQECTYVKTLNKYV